VSAHVVPLPEVETALSATAEIIRKLKEERDAAWDAASREVRLRVRAEAAAAKAEKELAALHSRANGQAHAPTRQVAS
jgi:hypothetical protein